MDWGAGSYEATASELAPASDVAIAALGLRGGEQVLDVACGTANAALLAHDAGAIATGLDASPRLLEVARERVPAARFVLGDCARLPFADGQFDAAVSVFGVIFAHPAEQAAAEIARVVAPGGLVVITTWPPRGALFDAMSLRREALERLRRPDGAGAAAAHGARSPAAPADWGEASGLETLLGPYGDLEISEHELAHEPATTPEEYWERWERLHPVWIAAREQLEPAGSWPRLRGDVIAALRDGGIGSGATSPYLLARLERC
jgi:SAM-dependent methyltransferase